VSPGDGQFQIFFFQDFLQIQGARAACAKGFIRDLSDLQEPSKLKNPYGLQMAGAHNP
jgi:hypothetical protein